MSDSYQLLVARLTTVMDRWREMVAEGDENASEAKSKGLYVTAASAKAQADTLRDCLQRIDAQIHPSQKDANRE